MRTLRTILTAATGNVTEWYEFSLFGFMASTLGRLFFPNQAHWTAIATTLLILAASFIARPIGAVLYGSFGDVLGRKRALTASIICMGGSTLAIGLLPTYQTLGIASPIMLIILRLIAGISAGGELGGSVSYLVESAPTKQRGLFGSIGIASSMLGVLTAAVITTLTNHFFTPEQVTNFAWRIPFLLSACTLAIGLYLRTQMQESASFSSIQDTPFVSLNPVKNTFSFYRKEVIQAALVVSIPFTINFLIIVFLPTYLSLQRHYTTVSSLTISVTGLSIIVISSLATGYFSRYFSRRKALIITSLLSLISAFALSHTLANGGYAEVFGAVMIFSLLEGCSWGLVMTFLSEIFPINIRYTALSLSYNIGAAIFVSATLFAAPILIKSISAHFAFMLILGLTACFTLLGLITLRKKQVVFIPGLTFGKDLFRHQIEYFRDTLKIKTYIVNYNKIQRNIDVVLQCFPKGPISIVAHSSLGAGVALAAAAQSHRIKNVICMPGWVKPNQFTIDFLKDGLQKMQDGNYSDFKHQLREVAIGENYKNRAQIMQQIEQVQDQTALTTSIRQCQLMINELDITPCLSKIHARVLVVLNQENDPWFTQQEANQLVNAVPNGINLVIKNNGHLPPYTSPRETNMLIELWTKS